MVVEIGGTTAHSAMADALWKLRAAGTTEQTRAGLVHTLKIPTYISIYHPDKRIIWDERRDANHFFHVMEFIWMMAGQEKVEWLLQFNKKYAQFAEETGEVHGAYGLRWREHFNIDQIREVARILKENPMDRRAVIGMWDPSADLGMGVRDVPCNTHIYFRVCDGELHMTVCNRSNDLVWGAFGANVVHMTMLQQLLAEELKLKLGRYRVFTNNLHMYIDRPDFMPLWKAYDFDVSDRSNLASTIQLIRDNETLWDFLQDAEDFVAGKLGYFRCKWFDEVAVPMQWAYLDRENRFEHIKKIQSPDWRLACQLWAERKLSSSTSTGQ